MATISMRFLIPSMGLLLLAGGFTPAWASPAWQDADPDPLGITVLLVGDRAVSAREVLDGICERDPSIRAPVQRNPAYRALYLRSILFRDHVRAYRDKLLLDAAAVPEANEDALHAEALAWSMDRKRAQPVKVLLASHGLEIDVRARLIGEQPEGFSTLLLRGHFMKSVPEFFGLMSCSWIRMPLFDPASGSALPEEEVKARWHALAGIADKLATGKIEWDDAVLRWSEDPSTRERKGKVGILRRNMADKFEEPFLRQVFAGHGFKNVEGHRIRGPILGTWWVYLVRIETIHIKGPVGLEQVRPKVTRSLREHLLQGRLQELREGTECRILVPPAALSLNG